MNLPERPFGIAFFVGLAFVLIVAILCAVIIFLT